VSLGALLAVFLAVAAVTWLAGLYLSRSSDVLDARFGLGEAVGGLLLLGLAGSLPELAITASAALSGELDVATGNLLGGIAMQTLVLVLLDATSRRGSRCRPSPWTRAPCSRRSSSSSWSASRSWAGCCRSRPRSGP
jgi:cation:H+ antiporter